MHLFSSEHFFSVNEHLPVDKLHLSVVQQLSSLQSLSQSQQFSTRRCQHLLFSHVSFVQTFQSSQPVSDVHSGFGVGFGVGVTVVVIAVVAFVVVAFVVAFVVTGAEDGGGNGFGE